MRSKAAGSGFCGSPRFKIQAKVDPLTAPKGRRRRAKAKAINVVQAPGAGPETGSGRNARAVASQPQRDRLARAGPLRAGLQNRAGTAPGLAGVDIKGAGDRHTQAKVPGKQGSE